VSRRRSPEPPPLPVHRSSGKLALSFREQIGEKIVESKQLDSEIRHLVLQKVNGVRATGILLDEAQSTLPPQDFRRLLGQLDLDGYAVRNYVAFAKKNKEPIEDFALGIRSAVEAALRMTGALPTPDGHGTQLSHDPPGFFAWASQFTMAFKVRFAKYLAAKPLDSWDRSQAESFVYGLRPILQVHKMVTDWLRKQQS
jgi:hypothetical protein